jgi:hypothetical protein
MYGVDLLWSSLSDTILCTNMWFSLFCLCGRYALCACVMSLCGCSSSVSDSDDVGIVANGNSRSSNKVCEMRPVA